MPLLGTLHHIHILQGHRTLAWCHDLLPSQSYTTASSILHHKLTSTTHVWDYLAAYHPVHAILTYTYVNDISSMRNNPDIFNSSAHHIIGDTILCINHWQLYSDQSPLRLARIWILCVICTGWWELPARMALVACVVQYCCWFDKAWNDTNNYQSLTIIQRLKTSQACAYMDSLWYMYGAVGMPCE